MKHRATFWLTAAALFAAFSAVAADTAEARQRRRRPPRRFLSAPAPERGRTPALDASGAPAAAGRDVAGAAFDGAERRDVLTGGTAVVFVTPDRVLVTNAYRGLAVIDLSGPGGSGGPRIVGSVTLDGTADRVFVDTTDGVTTAVVVSRDWTGAGGSTTVATIDISAVVADDADLPATIPAALSVLGSVSVDGGLVDAASSGGGVVLVTTEYGGGPYPMMDAAGGGPGRGVMKSRTADPGLAPEFWFPWGGGEATVRVARVGLDATTREPTLGTPASIEGTLLAASIDGSDVAVAVDTSAAWMPGPVLAADAASGAPQGASGGPVLADVDASGAAPVEDRRLALDGFSGVGGMDLSSGVARLWGWTNDGTSRVATFTMGSDTLSAGDTVDLPAWPQSAAFSGDRFAFTYGSGGDVTFEGGDFPAGPGGVRAPDAAVPGVDVRAVDLSDPADLVLGDALRAGDGWSASLHPVAGGVVAVITQYDETPTTTLTRVDLADVAAPAEDGTATLDGSWYGGHPLGDLLVLSGGEYAATGAYVPQACAVSVPETGGLTAGEPFGVSSWIAAAAWQSPLLGIASVDTFRLYDLSESPPQPFGGVRLAVNVADLAVIGDDVAACLVTDWVGGTIEVRTVSLPGADALAPLDTVGASGELGTGDARLLHDGPMLYVVGTDWSTGGGSVTVVDASDPAHLRVRGSLDLASYPGQAFVVNGALVLLRQASDFFDVDEETGRRTSRADDLGRCPRSWTRDEQSAVLDVVDLSDPDRPVRAARRRLYWDVGGEAVLRGSTLYVPSTLWFGTAFGYEQTLYGVRAVDLSHPTRPRIGPVVDVPGSLVAAADEDGRILTVAYDYDETTWTFTATLNLCDTSLRSWRRRVVASRDLGGTPGAVVAGADHVYAATEAWDSEAQSAQFALSALDLSDLGDASDPQARTTSAWGGRIAGGHLFLRSWGWTGAIDAYDLADPARPVRAGSASLDGVGTTIGVAGGRAYVPAGYRGVASFDLGE